MSLNLTRKHRNVRRCGNPARWQPFKPQACGKGMSMIHAHALEQLITAVCSSISTSIIEFVHSNTSAPSRDEELLCPWTRVGQIMICSSPKGAKCNGAKACHACDQFSWHFKSLCRLQSATSLDHTGAIAFGNCSQNCKDYRL